MKMIHDELFSSDSTIMKAKTAVISDCGIARLRERWKWFRVRCFDDIPF